MVRYYVGVDWADQEHQVCVIDEAGSKIRQMKLAERVAEMTEFGRWLDEQRGAGIELWASIEKPEGRIVDFLLDHGVVVYPVNPKALDRVRDRYRVSQSKSDAFDAYVLADFLRTDHGHLKALTPSSIEAQEMKIVTRDHLSLTRQKVRFLNQLRITLKEYYAQPLEAFSELDTPLALDFLKEYPTPQALSKLSRKQWGVFAKEHRLTQRRTEELWQALQEPQLPVPEHVVRAKAALVEVYVGQLKPLVSALDRYAREIERFFADMPAADLVSGLPGAKSGTLLPTLWAELGDAKERWESFRHLQAQAGSVPVTRASGKSHMVQFRFACNKRMRYALHWLAFASLTQSEWAKAYYQRQRARGHHHNQALRALGAKWLKIIFVIWRDHVPYDENYHLANIARQTLRQAI